MLARASLYTLLYYAHARCKLKGWGVRVMLRWLMSLCRTALCRWRHSAHCKQVQRVRWERLRFRTGVGRARSAFHEWRYFTGAQPHNSLERSTGRFVEGFLGGVHNRVHRAVVAWATRAWRECARARLGKRRKFARLVHARGKRAFGRALSAWRGYAEWQRSLHSMGVRVLVRSLKGAAKASLRGWYEAVAAQKRMWHSGEQVWAHARVRTKYPRFAHHTEGSAGRMLPSFLMSVDEKCTRETHFFSLAVIGSGRDGRCIA